MGETGEREREKDGWMGGGVVDVIVCHSLIIVTSLPFMNITYTLSLSYIRSGDLLGE